MKSRLQAHNKNKKKVQYFRFEQNGRLKKVNAYEKRFQNIRNGFITVGFLAGSIMFGAFIQAHYSITDTAMVTVSASEPSIESNASPSAQIQPSPLPTPILEPGLKGSEVIIEYELSKSEIEKLIRETFHETPNTAVAVAKGESGLVPTRSNKGRAGTLFKGYKGECSIGIFQINLASDGCKGKSVHASKVPGATLEEKIEWLEVPENNIKLARRIYEDRGNWSAWGAYTSGAYRKHL